MEKPLIGLDEKGANNACRCALNGLPCLLEEETLGGPQGGLLGDELLEVQEETEEDKGSEIYAESYEGRIQEFMAVNLEEVQALLYVKYTIHRGGCERYGHGEEIAGEISYESAGVLGDRIQGYVVCFIDRDDLDEWTRCEYAVCRIVVQVGGRHSEYSW